MLVCTNSILGMFLAWSLSAIQLYCLLTAVRGGWWLVTGSDAHVNLQLRKVVDWLPSAIDRWFSSRFRRRASPGITWGLVMLACLFLQRVLSQMLITMASSK